MPTPNKELVLFLRDQYNLDPETANTMALYMGGHPGARDAFPGARDKVLPIEPGTAGYKYQKGLQEKEAALNEADAKRGKGPAAPDTGVLPGLMSSAGLSKEDAAKYLELMDKQELDRAVGAREAQYYDNMGLDAYGRPLPPMTSPWAGLDQAKQNAEDMDAMEHRGATPAPAPQSDFFTRLGRKPMTPEQYDAAMAEHLDPYRQAGVTTDRSLVEVKRPFDSVTTRPGLSPLPSENYYQLWKGGQLQAHVPLDHNTSLQQVAREHHNEQVSGVKMLSEYLQAQDAQRAGEADKAVLWGAAVPGSMGSGYINSLGVKVR